MRVGKRAHAIFAGGPGLMCNHIPGGGALLLPVYKWACRASLRDHLGHSAGLRADTLRIDPSKRRLGLQPVLSPPELQI
jgi:hypothetical protein